MQTFGTPWDPYLHPVLNGLLGWLSPLGATAVLMALLCGIFWWCYWYLPERDEP